MANKTCGHLGKCGCETYLTTPPPCPTPENCPEAQPCSEVFDAGCIVYTGDPILCDQTTVVDTNNTLSTALQEIVDYICGQVALTPITIVDAGDGITVDSNTVGVTTTYTVSTSSTLLRKAVVEHTVPDGTQTDFTITHATYAACIPDVESCGAITATLSDVHVQGYYYNVGSNSWVDFTHEDKSVIAINALGDIYIDVAITPIPSYPVDVRIIIIG